MTIRIKDWQKFQHFKDRTPPWVKLYRDILDDPDWHDLDGESAKVLTMLWLIASEDETHTGALPEMRKLAFRLRIKEYHLNQILVRLSHWLIHDDINSMTMRCQVDAPEKETEKETEKEGETKPTRAARSSPISKPDDVSDQVWADWCQLRKTKKASVTETVLREARAEAEKAYLPLERFLSIWCVRGSQGLQADWLKPAERGRPTFKTTNEDANAEAARILGISFPGYGGQEVIDA